MKIEMQSADIYFNVGKKHHTFTIYHNLPQVQGMNVEDAVINWVMRTVRYTPESLCKYIVSKDPINFKAYTKAQYKLIVGRISLPKVKITKLKTNDNVK